MFVMVSSTSPINNSEVDFYYNYYNSKLNFKDSIIYSSPLKRCRDFAKRFKNDIHLEERLAEYHYGDWEGRLGNLSIRRSLMSG